MPSPQEVTFPKYIETLKQQTQEAAQGDKKFEKADDIIRQADALLNFYEMQQHNQKISDQISNTNFIQIEADKLKMLFDEAMVDCAEETKKKFAPYIKDLDTILQVALKQQKQEDTEEIKKLPNILYALDWQGNSDTISFYTKEELEDIVSQICKAHLEMGPKDTMRFEIQMPPPTLREQQDENAEKKQNDRIDEFAKATFKAAAEKGIDPDKCTVVINGKTISAKDEKNEKGEQKFAKEYDEWKKSASKYLATIRKECWNKQRQEDPPTIGKPKESESDEAPDADQTIISGHQPKIP